MSWSDGAVGEIVARSDGYPFFVQMWAYHVWNVATDEPISSNDVTRASAPTLLNLDNSFFAARLARIPRSEVVYVEALASLGPGPHRSRDVAATLGRTTSQVAAFRDRLLREGVIFAPHYGWVEFAIPHLDDFVRRSGPRHD